MLHKTCLALVVAAGTVMAGAATAATAEAARWPWPKADAVIQDTAGRNVGVLRIEHRLYNKSRVTIKVRNLRPGHHGLHIHAKGLCDPDSTDPVTGSPFYSAGPHFTLRSAAHAGHSGDLPNLLVAEDGTGEATVVTDRFRVGQLFDRDGSSIVIHALPDNHANIPDRYTHPADSTGTRGPDAETRKAGDSGGRIACGVITRRE
ncbi:hypothetical protein GCM10010517_07160 [Streptosporangium fragile]|uniref:Superoxide dismutase [Cu-Zn] n=1 Tax=Streptosporangium fragile TaxID=46186 RepID=A0ABN3VQG2_9ACTN